jgi:hypothetical protein
MVVDENGEHVTQRSHPRLALVQSSILGDRLQVSAPGRRPLDLPLEPRTVVTTIAVVWGEACAAHWMGERAATWFSEVLGQPCSLVYMPGTTLRPADPTYAPPGVRVSFADAFPLLLISEESLADLNTRLPTRVPMNRFRPNLVIAGGEPHVEDRLTTFRIGRLEFKCVKPCDRCVVTTTDQATAERGPEPLRTLATYRKVDGKVLFGQNVVQLTTGRLRIGEPVRV